VMSRCPMRRGRAVATPAAESCAAASAAACRRHGPQGRGVASASPSPTYMKPRDRSPAGRSEQSLATQSLAAVRQLSRLFAAHPLVGRAPLATSLAPPVSRDRSPQRGRSRNLSQPHNRVPAGRRDRSPPRDHSPPHDRLPPRARSRIYSPSPRNCSPRDRSPRVRSPPPHDNTPEEARPIAAQPVAFALADARPLARPLVTARLRSHDATQSPVAARPLSQPLAAAAQSLAARSLAARSLTEAARKDPRGGAIDRRADGRCCARRRAAACAAASNCATAVTRRRAADHRVITHAPRPKPPAADRYAARFCGRRSFSPHPRSGEQRAAFGVTRGGAGARHARLDRTLSAQPPGMGTYESCHGRLLHDKAPLDRLSSLKRCSVQEKHGGWSGLRSRRTRHTLTRESCVPVGGGASKSMLMCHSTMSTAHSFVKQTMEHRGALSRCDSSLTKQEFGSE